MDAKWRRAGSSIEVSIQPGRAYNFLAEFITILKHQPEIKSLLNRYLIKDKKAYQIKEIDFDFARLDHDYSYQIYIKILSDSSNIANYSIIFSVDELERYAKDPNALITRIQIFLLTCESFKIIHKSDITDLLYKA